MSENDKRDGKQAVTSDGNAPGEVRVPMPKAAVKAIFHLLTGRPDTTIKPFERDVYVDLDAIRDLSDRVADKLANHHCTSIVTSADVDFSDRTTVQFGGQDGLNDFRWKVAKETRQVRLYWKFLLDVPDFQTPQQHTLSVRLVPEGRPIEMLQAVFLNQPMDEMPDMENVFAPVVARVDFINHTLAHELLNIVEQWSNSLPQPACATGLAHRLARRRKNLFALLKYPAQFIFAFALVAYVGHHFSSLRGDSILSVATAIRLMQFGTLSVIVAYAFFLVTTPAAEWIVEQLDQSHRYWMFQLTSGDKAKNEKFIKQNQRMAAKFFSGLIISFVLNVVAGVLVAIYWPSPTINAQKAPQEVQSRP